MTLALTLMAVLATAAPPRFSGQAALEPPQARSADQRFELNADLLPGDRAQAGGRFVLDARLDASAQAKATAATDACAAVSGTVFQDSFE